MYIMTERGWRPLVVYCVNENNLEGVFRPQELSAVQAQLDARVDRFIHDLAEFHPTHNAGQFRGDHYIEPLFGAYGEKL